MRPVIRAATMSTLVALMAATGIRTGEAIGLDLTVVDQQMLLRYLDATTGTPPQAMDFADLTADVIGAFLAHLESNRHSSVTSRNARLAALHSLFTPTVYRHPEHAATISGILAIPSKRHQRTDLT